MSQTRARFNVGDCIHHRRFGYRGVIVDVDASFQGSDAWYAEMATSQPPKDAPWYHVLVHAALHTTYVAERNLEPDPSGEPTEHPLLDDFFEGFHDGRHLPRRGLN